MTSSATRRAGRPRAERRTAAVALTPREEILDAAAVLFVSQGVARTSTREIAEAVGMRQASLYYHFSGKEEMVGELLQRSIRPTVDKIEKVELLGRDAGVDADTLLYLLAMLDVGTLAAAPHNAGALARLPEVQGLALFDRFAQTRAELREAYERLGVTVEAASEPRPDERGDGVSLGTLLLQLVEVVIGMRSSGREIDEATTAVIAGGCLRVCGATTDRIEAAAAAAADLIGGVA